MGDFGYIFGFGLLFAFLIGGVIGFGIGCIFGR